MKLVKPNFIEWMSFITLMPIIDTAMCFVLFGSGWYSHSEYWTGFAYILIVALFPWYVDVVAVHWIHSVFPTYKSSLKRMIALVIKIFLDMLLSAFIIVYGLELLHIEGYHADLRKFWYCHAIGFGITTIATIIWEGDYIIKQWKEGLKEQEKYEQLTLQNEFDALKTQVNPHFLFNCFNTLSSLITEDKQQAEVFLNELSKVYRYFLRNNEDGLSTLKNEMEFIQSYFKLLKTRYGDAVQFELNIDPELSHLILPSLSLQMLVENAVKHNSLSKKNPVTVTIETTPDKRITVQNNLRPLIKKAPSGKIGLNNIRAKYLLLKETGFEITADDSHFTVVLPLFCEQPLG